MVFVQARLNELMSQIRLQQTQAGTSQGPADGKYVMDTSLQEELKQVPLAFHTFATRSFTSRAREGFWLLKCCPCRVNYIGS